MEGETHVAFRCAFDQDFAKATGFPRRLLRSEDAVTCNADRSRGVAEGGLMRLLAVIEAMHNMALQVLPLQRLFDSATSFFLVVISCSFGSRRL
jgi:hypothetical protein